jgi:hypothetical protein
MQRYLTLHDRGIFDWFPEDVPYIFRESIEDPSAPKHPDGLWLDFYLKGKRDTFSVDRRPDCEARHSPLSTAEVKNT